MAALATAADPRLTVRAGRVLAMRYAPYLSTGLLRMLVVETDDCPTAATDERWRFYINPAFAASLTVEQLAYVWLHEIGHCLRGHTARWRALNQAAERHVLFNIAGDALINADLDEITRHGPDDRITIPGLDVADAHRGMPVEELYRLLLRAAEQDCSGAGRPDGEPVESVDCGSGAGGEARPWERSSDSTNDGSLDPGDADLVRDAVAHEIAQHHRAKGDVPSGMRRWADDRLRPVVDWHSQLRAVVTKHIGQHAGRRDYSYRKPSRRRLPGVVLPGMVGHAPPSVAVVIDTSGSMEAADIARALAETGDLLRRLAQAPIPLRVIACDAAAHTAQTVRNVRSIELVGGGGTDMIAGIAAALDLKPCPDLIIVITDGFTPWPTAPPRVPVIAVLTQPGQPQRTPDWIRTIDAFPTADT